MEPPEFEGSGAAPSKAQILVFFALNALSVHALTKLLQRTEQILAGLIFIALVLGTLMFWRFRVGIAFLGMVLLLVTGTIDLHHMISFMSLDVILFLMGIMVIVGMLRRSGFFRWLLAQGLRFSKFRPKRLMVVVLFLSALMAAIVDEVTSILFVAALVIDLCEFFKVRPVRYIVSVILATNIGSS